MFKRYQTDDYENNTRDTSNTTNDTKLRYNSYVHIIRYIKSPLWCVRSVPLGLNDIRRISASIRLGAAKILKKFHGVDLRRIK